MTVAKIIEIVGSSERGWSEAAQEALDEAKKTINGITGLEVNDITAKVDPSSGKITEYRVGVKIAFGVNIHSQIKSNTFILAKDMEWRNEEEIPKPSVFRAGMQVQFIL